MCIKIGRPPKNLEEGNRLDDQNTFVGGLPRRMHSHFNGAQEDQEALSKPGGTLHGRQCLGSSQEMTLLFLGDEEAVHVGWGGILLPVDGWTGDKIFVESALTRNGNIRTYQDHTNHR